MNGRMGKQETIDAALEYLRKGYNCSQAVMLAFKETTGLDDKTAALVSSSFGGGMGRTKGRCGALSASYMVLGMSGGYASPSEEERKSALYKQVRELTKKEEDVFKVLNCNELLVNYPDGDEPRLLPGRKNICVKFVTATVGDLYDMLNNRADDKRV